MWYLAYNVLLILASPVILLILLVKKRCRRGLAQRLGWLPEGFLPNGRPGGQAVLWIHAVSLGEVVAAIPLVQELHRRYPTHRIVVSTVTETGREAVEQRLAGVAEYCYAPLDFPWVVARVVARVNPRGFLFIETELWPNLLRALARRGVPTILVNGRLSSRSFRRYRLIRPFMTQVLETLASCLMQSERDAERIVALGASPALVHRTGNIKFDQPRPDETGGSEGLSRGSLGLVEGEELIVAGSTHPGEEEQILSCYETLLQEFPCLVLLLAPRHIERAAEVEATARQRGLTVVRRSRLGLGGPSPVKQVGPRVIILDTRGELASVYRHAVLSYVGGTLVPVGGHNLLEPAQWGKPVFFGPYTDHCAEVAGLLRQAAGGVQVRDGADLAVQMVRLLRDRAALRNMGKAASQVVAENRGALGLSLDLIGQVLDAQPHARRRLAHAVPDAE
ncbi:MAG: 3-deoxy-D-manno-octulosonic acid transferase [Nitrospirae bacterium]|nr:MAG: 3-deoxy-D-manno-octulosonic acid transferase [Nitrospirota bacterium]